MESRSKIIAEKAGTNYRNVAVWFATTGKKFQSAKIKPATYRLVDLAVADLPPATGPSGTTTPLAYSMDLQ